MKVYCLYKLFGDGDSYTRFGLLSIHKTIDGARKVVPVIEGRMDLAHEDMNADNNYTVVAKRDDCCEMINYNQCGGYVIEETEIQD